MKKAYVAPRFVVGYMPDETLLETSAETDRVPVYNDEPIDGSQALARRHSIWDDDEDE